MASNDHQYEFSINEAVNKWRTLTANDSILLEEEFNSLRRMDEKRTTIGRNLANKSKNRYESIYPYDEDSCRICLKNDPNYQSDENSDYINASIIHCVPPNPITQQSTSRIFYAGQGPIEQTLDDFIRMIIEQQIAVIVMLSFTYDPITRTYAQEHAPYFSQELNGVIETKIFKIRTINIIPSYRYIGRRLRIKSKVDESVYVCEQYHYPHFIDKGVPSDYHSMIGLVMRLRQSNNHSRRIFVHCSAGIGRTGVFIALYYLLDAIERRQMLNVKQLVDTIRLYRAHLVQTAEQYEYIYRCIAEVAIHPVAGRRLEEFIVHYKKLSSSKHLKDSIIYDDFNNRMDRVELDTHFTTVMAEQHSDFNRNQSFIPYDQNRVILHSPSESTYINASTVTNVIGPKGTILTQEPMQSTLQHFFSMILQEHKSFIVAVEQMENPNYTESRYMGPNEITVDISSPTRSRNKFSDYHKSYKMKVKQSNVRESDVFIFEYIGNWANDIPADLEQFVRFIDRSIYHQKKLDPTRLGLIVHDRDGGTKAAFYCVAQNLFDRLLIDDRVSIENFVSDICQKRINAIQSFEQYIALHDIICIWNQLKNRGALECTANNVFV